MEGEPQCTNWCGKHDEDTPPKPAAKDLQEEVDELSDQLSKNHQKIHRFLDNEDGITKISKEDLFDEAKRIYGPYSKKWEFTCPNCGNAQSINSIMERAAQGEISKRFGPLKGIEPEKIQVDCLCYGSTCNWSANGLFTTKILVVYNPQDPHNEARKENCHYVFPFSRYQPLSEAPITERLAGKYHRIPPKLEEGEMICPDCHGHGFIENGPDNEIHCICCGGNGTYFPEGADEYQGPDEQQEWDDHASNFGDAPDQEAWEAQNEGGDL